MPNVSCWTTRGAAVWDLEIIVEGIGTIGGTEPGQTLSVDFSLFFSSPSYSRFGKVAMGSPPIGAALWHQEQQREQRHRANWSGLPLTFGIRGAGWQVCRLGIHEFKAKILVSHEERYWTREISLVQIPWMTEQDLGIQNPSHSSF